MCAFFIKRDFAVFLLLEILIFSSTQQTYGFAQKSFYPEVGYTELNSKGFESSDRDFMKTNRPKESAEIVGGLPRQEGDPKFVKTVKITLNEAPNTNVLHFYDDTEEKGTNILGGLTEDANLVKTKDVRQGFVPKYLQTLDSNCCDKKRKKTKKCDEDDKLFEENEGPCDDNNDFEKNDNDAYHMKMILDKIFQNLEDLKTTSTTGSFDNKTNNDGKCCNLAGQWKSHVLGITLLISPDENSGGQSSRNYSPKACELVVKIRSNWNFFGKSSHVISSSWIISGGTLDINGGPFYLNTHSPKANILGSFLGICRSCDHVDTIFGAWTFIAPAKNFVELSTSIQTRRDVFQRVKVCQ